MRRALAAKAFTTPASTRALNRITVPRIEDLFMDMLADLEKEGHEAVVVEQSVFKNRQMSLAYSADVVIAILAKFETRVERAVASGWEEDDVRRRMARQITDAERIEFRHATRRRQAAFNPEIPKIQEVAMLMDAFHDDPFWDELGGKCLSCTACSSVSILRSSACAARSAAC